MLLRCAVAGLAISMLTCPPDVAAEQDRQGRSSSDWHFLPTAWVDNWIGAFHDSKSGAFVTFARGITSMLRPSTADEGGEDLVKGLKGGWSYSYIISPVPFDGTDAWSDSCAAESKQPRHIEASFSFDTTPYLVWNLGAYTCTEQELARVVEFLFQDPDRWSSAMNAPRWKVLRLREGDIAQLRHGQEVKSVLESFGLAQTVERRGAGFEMTFWLVDSRDHEARLRFDGSARLVEWGVEPTAASR